MSKSEAGRDDKPSDYVPWDLDAVKQEICDLFARYGSGNYMPTEEEKGIIDTGLDEILTMPPVAPSAKEAINLHDVIYNRDDYRADGKRIVTARLEITTEDGMKFYVHKWDHGCQQTRITHATVGPTAKDGET